MKKSKKNNVVNFPSSLTNGEREVEAILFAAAEPLNVDTIESKVGDLVILNPNYLHEVSKIQGNSDRVTLGMFFGVQSKNRKIFSWA